MRTISDIYAEYKIPPNLQEHMLRVAGIVEWICENTSADVDAQILVTAALVHDMGNILKFDEIKSVLEQFPELQEKGLEYWQNVQNEFKQKYGNDERQATSAIAREIGVNEKVITLIEGNPFRLICTIAEDPSLEKKISKYADLRTGLHGIITLKERIDDYEKRYNTTVDETLRGCAHAVETKIFESIGGTPELITDEIINQKLTVLRSFEL